MKVYSVDFVVTEKGGTTNKRLKVCTETIDTALKYTRCNHKVSYVVSIRCDSGFDNVNVFIEGKEYQ